MGEVARAAPQVSVVVPVLNEAETIVDVLDRVLALSLSLEAIVVDDGSTDDTPRLLERFGDRIVVLRNPTPQGKGAAIRLALARARGEVVVIQDADLEYLPEELPRVVGPILAGEADVVLGTRFARGMPPGMALPNRVVNVLLAWSARALYGLRITDEATCYKAVRRDVLLRMRLVCRRFEFCPEVIAKAARLKARLVEVPISYTPRTKSAGKKIRWTDAPEAFWTLLRHRFWRG